jgi:proline iminopeptidase
MRRFLPNPLLLLLTLLLSWPAASLAAQTPAAPEFAHGNGSHLETSRGKLYVEVEGSGPPLVLVEGGPGSSHMIFHPWFSRVAAAGRSVVYFDNLGRGRSDRLASGQYTVDSDIEDIEALRLGLGLERIDLLGLSYGGIPALGYALAHPDRVRRLVMCDAEYDGDSWQQDTEFIKEGIRARFPDFWERLLAFREKGLRSSDPDHANLFDKVYFRFLWYDVAQSVNQAQGDHRLDRFSPTVYYALVGLDGDWEPGGSLKGYHALDRARKLTVPTLVTVGRYDGIVSPATAWRLKRALPAATSEWTVFEKSGHHAFIEEPDAFFQRLLEFLETP